MTDTDDDTDFDPAVLMARQSLYRFTAITLLDPKAGSWEQLDASRQNALLSEAATLIRDLPAANLDKLGLGERPLSTLDPAHVLARLPDTCLKLNEEFENTFGLLVSNACPPYETEYINSKYAFQRSNSLADVSGYYRAFGLTVSATYAERPDHIAKELEFMAFLVGLERQAASGDASVRQQRLEVCRDAQARFLREHVAWWRRPSPNCFPVRPRTVFMGRRANSSRRSFPPNADCWASSPLSISPNRARWSARKPAKDASWPADNFTTSEIFRCALRIC